MISLLLSFLLLFQSGVQDDVSVLQKFLGATFPQAMQLLVPRNEQLIRNTQAIAPAQAEDIRNATIAPAALPDTQQIFPLTVSNVGKGLVTTLFELDFLTEQVNLVFCPAQAIVPPPPRRVIAVQVLFDDRRALGDTAWLFSRVYQLPAPAVFAAYVPALKYPLEGIVYDAENKWTNKGNGPSVTVWDIGNSEAVYQAVSGQKLVTGQFWIVDKTAAKACAPTVSLQD